MLRRTRLTPRALRWRESRCVRRPSLSTVGGCESEPGSARCYWKRTLTSLLTPGSSMVTP